MGAKEPGSEPRSAPSSGRMLPASAIYVRTVVSAKWKLIGGRHACSHVHSALWRVAASYIVGSMVTLRMQRSVWYVLGSQLLTVL